jgi:hypothetical protein
MSEDVWGKVAYEAYCGWSDGKSLVTGAVLPAWEDQSSEIKAAWNAAAQAVREAASHD